MKILTLNNYMTDENTYILYDENIRKGIVIDPGIDYEKIINEAEKNDVCIKYIFITHCHYDHISDLIPLKKQTGAKVVSGDKASINISDPYINLSSGWEKGEICAGPSDIIISDGENINAGGIDIKCIYTPGHTNCSVCYISGEYIFTGDTLFLRSIGRSDLPTGSTETIEKSIREKIYKLDEKSTVFPGHGRKSSIEYEKKFNLFVRE